MVLLTPEVDWMRATAGLPLTYCPGIPSGPQ